ncbi:thrombospondin-type laminin G domain and EAR repeat-containing protein-like isoform X2 [Xiphophorus hellerii]|uniref:thrombospondin-type laminin G domain and EAR repeat-containing protein-like isoform X2 n=1 Tax=Xiphophorus hellerii TaxID=8084 RepID=UPI0013B35E1E|nr:thrombospondin-type laminin G domain and EAR repeat-containing protein-like isoform X2 [Xiphophorus hellerii]
MSMQIFILLLLWASRVTETTTDAWRQCTELLPLDLLSFVLERDTSRVAPGARVKQSAGARGVQFLSPDASMSFPASQLLANCDLFPKEFSIVITVKVNRFAPKRDEYVFSLMGRSNVEAVALEEKEDEQRLRKKETKSDEKHAGVILGLKLSQNSLHFVFNGHRKAAEHWSFQGIRLTPNQWHTLVLVIGLHHRKLTVDCNPPLESGPSRAFPSDLNIQASRFHIGSRGRWKGLFSGLMRQLVLVPNSDASNQLCPSSDPRLAALSVPPLLLDLPVRRRQNERHDTSSEAAGRLSVGVERPCSELLRGQLWFNPLKKGLYVCDGSVWITVLEDHKRLDYVLEQQVLTTSSETHDVEVFQIQGIGLMAAMAHRSSASGSAVYLWTNLGFRLYQNISTHGALSWKHFQVGKKAYLVVSNSGTETNKSVDKQPESDFSVIYKWSNRRKRFVQFQTLQTYCARDWEAFNINEQTYLAVANHRMGNNNHTINSVIYKWSRSTKSFEVHQTLITSGAYDWEFFKVGPYHFLVVANAFDGMTTSLDSVIYVWIDGKFQVFQIIKTFCATDWEMFQIGSRVFLVVANGHRFQGNGPSQYTINSTIYELDMSGRMFVRFQDIVTYSGLGVLQPRGRIFLGCC